MSADFEIKIEGIDELRKRLEGLAPKLRRRALRNSLAAGARLVRDAARLNRRSSSSGNYSVATLRYNRGTVERAISVRTSKIARRAGDVGVFVNVRPVRFGAGRYNPNDPFYWRFLEFGTKRMHARPFLKPAGASLEQALAVIVQTLGPQIQKLDTDPNDPL